MFFRIFGFGGSNISAMFLCRKGNIVKILCSRWRHNWRYSNRFWSGHPWKLKKLGNVVMLVQKKNLIRLNKVEIVICLWWYHMVAVEYFCWFVLMLQLNIWWLL